MGSSPKSRNSVSSTSCVIKDMEKKVRHSLLSQLSNLDKFFEQLSDSRMTVESYDLTGFNKLWQVINYFVTESKAEIQQNYELIIKNNDFKVGLDKGLKLIEEYGTESIDKTEVKAMFHYLYFVAFVAKNHIDFSEVNRQSEVLDSLVESIRDSYHDESPGINLSPSLANLLLNSIYFTLLQDPRHPHNAPPNSPLPSATSLSPHSAQIDLEEKKVSPVSSSLSSPSHSVSPRKR